MASEQGTAASVLPRMAKAEVRNVRREVWGARLWFAASIVAMVGLPWALTALHEPGVAGLSFVAAALFYLWSAQSMAATDPGVTDRKLEETEIAVEGGDLKILKVKYWVRLPLSQVTSGWVESTGSGWGAVLNFADGQSAVIELPNEEEAAKVLRALAPAVETRAVRMRGYREDVGGRRIAGCLLAVLGPLAVVAGVVLLVSCVLILLGEIRGGMPGLVGSLTGGGVFFAITAWLLRKLRPTWIQVGADGVLLPGLLRPRFLPHARISGARPRRGGLANAYHFVEILVAEGRSALVPASTEAEAGAMAGRILQAKKASAEGERARLLDVLARNDRPVAEWREALSGILGKGGYRSVRHEVEDVLQIVEDPGAPREQRVAAAVAARSQGDPAVKDRIRVAAETCAEPRLRVALEKASTGEIDDESLSEIAAAEEASA